MSMGTTTTAAARPERAGKRAAPDSKPISMKRFSAAILEHYRSKNTAYRTIVMIRRVLSLLETDLGLRTVAGLERESIVRRFKALCAEKNWMASTERAFETRIISMARLGLKLGLLRTIPVFPTPPNWRSIEKSDRTLPPSEAAVQKLMRYLQRRSTTWEGGRLHALVAVVALTGNQLTSTLNIRVEDIDTQARMIRVKNLRGRYITIRISEEVSAILSAWLPRVHCEWAFPGVKQVGRWTVSGASACPGPNPSLLEAARNAGVGRITYEQLRRFHKEKSATSFQLGLKSNAATHQRRSGKCIVALDEQGRRASIRGKDAGSLSRSRFELVKLLRDAGPTGLSAREIGQGTEGGWWQTLDKLRKSDPAWAEAIVFPGGPYGGKYRLFWTED
jgi:integrase